MRTIIMLISILSSSSAWTFSSEKCFNDIGNLGFPGAGISSMTQFTSSFGGCNAFGTDEGRRVFLKKNNDSLKQEIAAGIGEHLEAFNELYGCNLKPLLQKNIKSILDPSGNLIFKKTDELAKSECDSKG